jgi:hypothetical protein
MINLESPTLKHRDRPIVIFLHSLVSARTISEGGCIYCFRWFNYRLPFSSRPFAIDEEIDVVSLIWLTDKTPWEIKQLTTESLRVPSSGSECSS